MLLRRLLDHPRSLPNVSVEHSLQDKVVVVEPLHHWCPWTLDVLELEVLSCQLNFSHRMTNYYFHASCLSWTYWLFCFAEIPYLYNVGDFARGQVQICCPWSWFTWPSQVLSSTSLFGNYNLHARHRTSLCLVCSIWQLFEICNS